MTKFLVKVSAAKMPNSCKFGIYKRIAVLEVEGDVTSVAMISERAPGVVSVVKTWERLNVGHTSRCAFWRAMNEATELARSLNAGAGNRVAWIPEFTEIAS